MFGGMRHYLTLTLLLLFSTAFGQVEFTMDGQVVDQTVLQQTFVPAFSGEGAVIGFRNVSQDTLYWRFGQCRLNDDPNIEPEYIVYSHDTDWLNEFGIQYGSITLPCWDMYDNGALTMDLEPGEGFLIRKGFAVSGDGCETFRFKVIQDSVYIDSIDVEYCHDALDLVNLSSDEMLMYPNPTSVKITVNNQIQAVQIFNAVGVLVKEVRLEQSQEQVNVADLADGTYILRLKDAQGQEYLENLIIQH